MIIDRRDRTNESLAPYFEPIRTIAKTLLTDIAKLAPGQTALLWYDTDASILIKSMEQACLQGQITVSQFVHDVPGYVELFKSGQAEKVEKIFMDAKGMVETTDYVLFVRAVDPRVYGEFEPNDRRLYNTFFADALSGMDSRKNGWTFITWPTNYEAQREGLDYKTYLGKYLKACEQHWDEIEIAQNLLKEKMTSAKRIRVKARGTDLTMEISRDKEIESSTIGHNFPGSEVSFAPVDGSVDGTLFSPGVRMWDGKPIRDITITIKQGRIAASQAKEGARDLEVLLDSHPGYRYLGDVIIGTNPGASGLFGNHMTDLKGAGHFTVYAGRTEKDLTRPTNDELITPKHYNLTFSTLVSEYGGSIFLDGKLLQRNGRYSDEQLSVISAQG